MEVCGEYYNMESGGSGLYIQALKRGPSGVLTWKVRRDNVVLALCRESWHYCRERSGGAALRRLRLASVPYPVGFVQPPAASGPRDGIAGEKKRRLLILGLDGQKP